MLLTKTVKIKWNSINKKYYESKGYIFTKIKDELEVRIEDLTKGSNILVEVKCDCKDYKNPYLKPITWASYVRCIHKDNTYYCFNCGKKLFAKENEMKTKLLNSQSFYDWCIKYDRYDILMRWDYKLNKNSPRDIFLSTGKKYYFKCPKGMHMSELKSIIDFTSGHNGTMDCKACNSFAQWGIDNIGNNFLEKYWDYEKNSRIDPWKISRSSHKKVFIFCQNKDYHNSYPIICKSFFNGHRCGYCSGMKIHSLDSLGQYIISKYGEEFLYKIWSNKNNKSPFEYAPHSEKNAWFKCLDGKHNDYYRKIQNSNVYNFRCPECQFSQGEKRIEEYLKINNVNYIKQKEYKNLTGLRGGNLSYDFYLLDYNLLIEFQGRQHEKYIPGLHSSKKDFEKQVEHDRRKKEYAKNNNINLLEIWYWDFNNIEDICTEYLDLKVV